MKNVNPLRDSIGFHVSNNLFSRRFLFPKICREVFLTEERKLWNALEGSNMYGIWENLVFWQGTDTDDSCFYAYDLLY